MALHTQRCCMRSLFLRLPVSASLRCRLRVTRYAVFRWPVLILVLTTPCLLPNTFSVCAREFFDQLIFSQPVLSEPVSVFILTGTIACFTVANLIICLHRCLASGGWAGLSTTLRSFCSMANAAARGKTLLASPVAFKPLQPQTFSVRAHFISLISGFFAATVIFLSWLLSL